MNHLVITGGEGGLGKAIASAFSDVEWTIDAPGRSQLDVTDAASIDSYFATRQVDLLVCAAGMIRDKSLGRTSADDWDEVFAVNYRGGAKCAAAVLPGMIRRNEGHIIFISSHSALHPPSGQIAYATAKAALLGLTTALAKENGQHNIRVNAILPGFLDTPMTAAVSEARASEILSDHALGRFYTPAVAAKFIRHLHEHLPHTSGLSFQLDSRDS